MRWDNTFRYNIGGRVQRQDPVIVGDANSDDGDRNFAKGSLVTNRLDVLSEFDLVWRRAWGARVAAALWYDDAYRHLDNTNNASANTLVDGAPRAAVLSPYAKRYLKGPSGEWLDAFVFGNFDLVGMQWNIKAGQHTVVWGDSLLLGGALHSVSYAQNSVDLLKGAGTPGAEAKELFRPRGGITLQAQVDRSLSVAGQWFYNWQAAHFPESGAYLSGADLLNFGADSLSAGPTRLWNQQAVAPSRYSGSLGDWGLSARWSPQWVRGTLGFYYRTTTDILPQLITLPNYKPLPEIGKAGEYRTAYGDNIHIMGITLSKSIGGLSTGAELSYRRNMPLLSDPVQAVKAPAPGQISIDNLPGAQGTPGALGNTYHGLVNAFSTISAAPWADSLSFAAELTWMRWIKVTQNAAVFRGRDDYTKLDKPSRDFFGAALNFTPTWFQVWPSVDLMVPLSYSRGVRGNAAVLAGGNEGAGSYALGIAGDIRSKHRIDLKYTGYFGNYSTSATGTTFNGANAGTSDRGWWSLTFKTTF